MTTQKTTAGNTFEDFRPGQILTHATPRTITAGDVAVYNSLYGPRFAPQSADPFAQQIGYPRAPIDDLLVFNVVFGKSVPDVSINAVANLGYAECRFLKPVYPGDTLHATSEVLGVRETSTGETGVVWVRTRGLDQHGDCVLEFARWVMVRKRDRSAAAPPAVVPALAARVAPEMLATAVPPLRTGQWDLAASGSPYRWSDYAVGERISHADGQTIEEAEHQMATRLYQNTAKVHFNQHTQAEDRFGRRLVYGGVVISMARALSFNGLGNAFHITAINAGRHVAPCFAGDTVYAWSEVLEAAAVPGRADIGALRLRLVALKNRSPHGFPLRRSEGAFEEGVVLELDYWAVLPC